MLKEKTITLQDRENKHTFTIREMPVRKRFDWKARFILLLSSTNADLQNDVDLTKLASGSQGISMIRSLLSGVKYEQARPLIEELLNCCERIIDGQAIQVTFDTIDGYIEDDATLMKLIQEAFLLNNSFFVNAAKSASQEKLNTERPATKSEEQPIIQTFQRK